MFFVLNKHTQLDVYSANSLKQQYTDIHVASLEHNIVIPNKPVFALTP